MIPVTEFLRDRIQINSLLIVLSFLGVLALSSQSASSYPTYFLALVMLWRFRDWNDVFAVRYLWFVLALLGYLVVSSFWSTPFEWRDVVSVTTRALLVALFVIAFAESQLRGQLRSWLGRSLAVVASIVAVVTLIVYFESDDYALGRSLKGLGQLDNSIIAALVFGAGLIFVTDLIMTERVRGWRVLGTACVPILLFTIYLCGSRNAWLSVSVGLGVHLIARFTDDVQKFAAGVVSLAVLLVVLLAALLAGESTREVLLPRGDSYRPDIWQVAIDRIVSGGAIFGLGINTPDAIFANGLEFEHPHSLYVSVFWQGGLVGLVLFGALILATLRGLTECYDHDDARLALSLFAIAGTGYLLDGHELIDKVSDVWFLFWLPVAICLGLLWRKPRLGD